VDGTRTRRVRDQARRAWYARHRLWRFARHLGFPGEIPVRGESAGGNRHSGLCSPMNSRFLERLQGKPGPDES
jgi:hypothetical protein